MAKVKETNIYNHLNDETEDDNGEGKMVVNDAAKDATAENDPPGESASDNEKKQEEKVNNEKDGDTAAVDDKNDDKDVDSGIIPKENDEQKLCGECAKDFSSIKLKGVTSCCLCNEWFCQTCTKIKPNLTIQREDVFWTCKSCKPKLILLLKSTPHTPPSGSKFEILEDKLMETIEKTVRQVIPVAMTECFSDHSTKIASDMTKLWSSTLYGDDFPAFDSSITKSQAKRIAQASGTATSPPSSVFGAVRHAVQQQKTEDKQQETRRKTIVIYRAPETVEPDFNKRVESDEKKVSEVIASIGLNTKPVKVYRVGKFEAPEAGQSPKPRPIKVLLENHEEAKEVVEKSFKLKDADDQLKILTVSFDATKEERNIVREMVADAKQKTQDSPNLVYKVRGPPWNPALRHYPKE